VPLVSRFPFKTVLITSAIVLGAILLTTGILYGINTFTTKKTINITSPTSTSAWTKGNTYMITWSSTGAISAVKLEVQSFLQNYTISAGITNNGSCPWYIPANFSTGPNFKIKITDTADAAVHAYSDYFEINTMTSIPRITVSNITVTVNYKNGTIQTKGNISSYTSNATVFDIMNNNFQLAYQSYPAGIIITGINGANYSWTFKVNGIIPSTTCDHVVVENDSRLEWDYS